MKETMGIETLETDATVRESLFDRGEYILGQHPAIRRVGEHAQRAAEVQCTVLISGETGTGKEVWAKMIHDHGPRAEKPLVPVNCAALTSTLAESQLFGHEKGAFTGAFGASLGVFRAAEGGIVFLDEVGEMPLELQPKLLRVLQEQEVTPVGAASPTKVNVQVVAATNRRLEEEVEAGRFREDLYFRLNMVELRVPSLRERNDDVPTFMDFFAKKFAAKYDRPVWQPTSEETTQFCEFAWPGNIRQLAHVIEQAYVLQCRPTLPNQLKELTPSADRLPFLNLTDLRKTAVKQALQATKGHKGKAAGLLGVHANTLTRMLAELDEE